MSKESIRFGLDNALNAAEEARKNLVRAKTAWSLSDEAYMTKKHIKELIDKAEQLYSEILDAIQLTTNK